MKPPSDRTRTSTETDKKPASRQVKEETEEWDPEPAQLREGETVDVTSHAARNIEQIRLAVREGDLSPDEGREAETRIRRRDEADEKGGGGDV